MEVQCCKAYVLDERLTDRGDHLLKSSGLIRFVDTIANTVVNFTMYKVPIQLLRVSFTKSEWSKVATYRNSMLEKMCETSPDFIKWDELRRGNK